MYRSIRVRGLSNFMLSAIESSIPSFNLGGFGAIELPPDDSPDWGSGELTVDC
ncbi:hypothetical protein QUA42_02135 [Microcoleus sp. Pol11C2]|uniref:hypothetical protein n=1 Tax=Microcoleus sp. Pol11C2 TaxID=3055389 RepID=UPI002FD43159